MNVECTYLQKYTELGIPILYKVAVEKKLLIPCEDPPGPYWIYMLMLAEYSVEDFNHYLF